MVFTVHAICTMQGAMQWKDSVIIIMNPTLPVGKNSTIINICMSFKLVWKQRERFIYMCISLSGSAHVVYVVFTVVLWCDNVGDLQWG